MRDDDARCGRRGERRRATACGATDRRPEGIARRRGARGFRRGSLPRCGRVNAACLKRGEPSPPRPSRPHRRYLRAAADADVDGRTAGVRPSRAPSSPRFGHPTSSGPSESGGARCRAADPGARLADKEAAAGRDLPDPSRLSRPSMEGRRRDAGRFGLDQRHSFVAKGGTMRPARTRRASASRRLLHDRRASPAHKRAKLSYDDALVVGDDDALTYGVGCTSFVLGPWAFLTAARRRAGPHRAAAGERLLDGERRGLPDLRVPAALRDERAGRGAALRRHDDGPGSSPSRLQTSYKRWWQARELWGQGRSRARARCSRHRRRPTPRRTPSSWRTPSVGLRRAGAAQRAPGRRRRRRSATGAPAGAWPRSHSPAHLRGGGRGSSSTSPTTMPAAVGGTADSRASGIEREHGRRSASRRPRRSRRTRRCGTALAECRRGTSPTRSTRRCTRSACCASPSTPASARARAELRRRSATCSRSPRGFSARSRR